MTDTKSVIAELSGAFTSAILTTSLLEYASVSFTRVLGSFHGSAEFRCRVRTEHRGIDYSFDREWDLRSLCVAVDLPGFAKLEAIGVRDELLRAVARRTATEERVLELEQQLAGIQGVAK